MSMFKTAGVTVPPQWYGKRTLIIFSNSENGHFKEGKIAAFRTHATMFFGYLMMIETRIYQPQSGAVSYTHLTLPTKRIV